jgi:hypothetical protein
MEGEFPFNLGVPGADSLKYGGPDRHAGFLMSLKMAEDEIMSRGEYEGHRRIQSTGYRIIEYMTTPPPDATYDPINNTIVSGLDSIFYSMILGSYAAFEALSEDLWVAAVNRKPKLYKKIKGSAGAKTITLDDIEKVGYDVKNRMGDLLLATDKVGFRKIESIAEAYEYTFGNGDQGCRVFKANPDIYKVAKVRNLIAHKSGRADRPFIKAVRDGSWVEFEGAQEGKHVMMNGLIVRSLINTCVNAAVDLVRFIDQKMSVTERD